VVPFHCVTRYPTDPSRANLSRMARMTWGNWPFGYSDHSIGIEACVFALAMGASVIEKHFSLPGEGRNQAWDMDPAMLSQLAGWRDKWVQMRGGPAQDGERDPDAERFIGRWCADGK
jgi:sialic acid synthase SpsE